MEIELEVVEPGDMGVDVFLQEFLGQVLVVLGEEFGVGGVVEVDVNGIVLDPDVSVESAKEVAREVRGIPLGIGFAEALSELMKSRLRHEGHAHVSVADMEIEGAGAVPSQRLVGVEEFFDVPSFGIIVDEGGEFLGVAGAGEPLVVIGGGFFAAPLYELV